MTPLQMTLIGAADTCRVYLPLLSGDPAIQLVDLDPAGPEALLESPELDAVVVAGSGDAHAAWAERAARAGKHVLCDYPLGTHREACRTIMGAVAVGGATFMIGARARYARLVGHLQEGLAGTEGPRTLHIQALAAGPCDASALRAFDLVCTLAGGDPVNVYAVGRTVTIGFSDDSTATVTLLPPDFRDVVESRLMLYVGGAAAEMHGWQALRLTGFGTSMEEDMTLVDPDGGEAAMLETFVRLARGEQVPGADIREAMRSSIIGFLAEESVEAGGVALPISRKDYVIGAVSC